MMPNGSLRAPIVPPPSTPFLGDSAMAAQCRALDWAATPLGAAGEWPAALCVAAGLVLGAAIPMILLWGPELVQIYNDGYAPFLATKHPDGLGRPTRDVWPEVWHLNAPIYARVLAGETVALEEAHFPVTRQGPDGAAEDLYITLAYSPAPDGAGGVGGVLITLQDMTGAVAARRLTDERARLTAALAADREDLLTEVFHRAPSFLHVLRGPDLVLELANPAYYQLVGHRDLIGRPAFNAMPEADADGFAERIHAVMATQRPFVGRELPVTVARTPDAPPEERLIDIVYLPIVEPDGTCTRVLGHGTDVTTQVRARRDIEAALATERERQQALVQQTLALQGITAALAEARTLDDVARIVVGAMATAAGARAGSLAVPLPPGDALLLVRTFGFPEPVVATIRVQPLDLATPITESFLSAVPLWAPARDGPHGMDARYPAVAHAWAATEIASGAYLPLIVAGQVAGVIAYAFAEPHAFAEVERAFLLALAAQVALAVERARLWEAERAARMEAEHASRTKAEFVATMSHELRTPLNAIGGYAELLELGIRGPVTDAQRADLARIQASQRHLLGLVNEVLDLAKIDAGAVPVDQAAVVASDTVDAALALVRPQAAAKGLALGDACAGAMDAAYLGDEPRVRQILVNLLANAVKFTPPSGTVEVTCAIGVSRPAILSPDAGPYLALRVEDTGIGIAPDQQARIFEPFTQAAGGSNPYTRLTGGTGLGLTISRRFARLMGGELSVESTPGVGSAFTLWLPMVDRRTAPRHSGASVPMGGIGEGEAAHVVTRVHADASSVERLDAHLAHLGDALLAEVIPVIRTWVTHLRADADIPTAHADGRPFTDAELENHAATFVTDVALALRTLAAGGSDIAALLRDGTAILGMVAERHGAQRVRLGWPAAALRRELELLGQEIEAALSRATPRSDEPTSVHRALTAVRHLMAQGIRVSLGGHRLARLNVSGTG